MNYYALDEALEYLDSEEYINESDAGLIGGIIGGCLAAVGAAIVASIVRNKVDNKNIDKVFKDTKVQEQFKKAFNTVQNDLKKNEDIKKYTDYMKFEPYNYNLVYNKAVSRGDKIYVDFNIALIETAKLFESIYKKSPKDFTDGTNKKPASKFKTAVKEIDSAAKKYFSKAKSKLSKFSAVIGISADRPTWHTDRNSDWEDVEYYYASFVDNSGSKDSLNLTLRFIFEADKITKNKSIEE